MDKTEALEKIREEVSNLAESPLYAYRIDNKNYPVIGEGSINADIMLIGEAPGKNEAETGRPFCGRSGKVLDVLLESVGITRADVYITNIVKDRPPGNRDPLPKEIALYGPFLNRQIEIIEPKILATLGRFSMEYIMNQFDLSEEMRPIGLLHGKILTANTAYGSLTIVPLYHPAVAVYNSKMIDVLKEDFQTVKKSI